jgi:hypothetical protein
MYVCFSSLRFLSNAVTFFTCLTPASVSDETRHLNVAATLLIHAQSVISNTVLATSTQSDSISPFCAMVGFKF